MKNGTLYLLPNTLGIAHPSQPLFDVIPVEVQKITANLAYFVAENAKTTRAFLKLVNSNFPLAKPLQEIQISELNVNTKESALPDLLSPLLQGHDVGLISEAGVPAVADPGANLVKLAHQCGIKVRPMVGPSSLLLAVMASGLNGQSFAFNGYLPTDAALRSKRLQELELRSRKDKQTQLFIETPYRNAALLEAFCQSCNPATELCVATDLSLETEQIQTLPVSQWKALLAKGKMPDFNKKPTVFLFLA
ncbi:SAM-dependent methyltransferase [Solimicrobium silvestre]|uniref:Putative methyltransferase n=1 Tax=Solimicrobium silvestre TaxID=2099400 RepID=A0A2S9GZG7_9BURK|nr:SAM-dependent methyltransferase [Solimicrobium silvestre]PRC93121.1 putative methyltransferase [Solimicrobium silvestre]